MTAFRHVAIHTLLMVFVFLLPWQTRWIFHDAQLNGSVWEYGRMSLFVTDVLLIALLAFALIDRKAIMRRLRNSTLGVIILVLLVISLLSTFLAPDFFLSWYAFLRLFLAVGLFVFLIRQRVVRLETVLTTFVFAAVLQSVIAIGQFFTQQTFPSTLLGLAEHDAGVPGTAVVETASGRFLRAYGSLPHPNVLAGFLSVALLILLGFLFRFYGKVRGWFHRHPHSRRRMLDEQERHEILAMILQLTGIVSAAVLISFGLFFTSSRSAWIGTIAAGLVIGLILTVRAEWYRLWVLGKFCLIVAVSVLFAASFAPGFLATRVAGVERIEARSIAERTAGFSDAQTLLASSWHTGVGIGSYTLAVHDQIADDRPGYDYQPVHSLYLLIAVEISVFGLLTLLAFLIESLHQFFLWLLKPLGTKTPWPLILGAASFSLLLIAFLDHFLWSLPVGLALFWLTLGFFWRSMGPEPD